MKVTPELRSLIEAQYMDGKMATEISANLRLKRTTVSSIIKKYRDTGSWESGQRGGARHSKVNAKVKTFLRELLAENCTFTLMDLKQKVLEKFSLDLSATSIHFALLGLHWSFKRAHQIPFQCNTERALTRERFMQISLMRYPLNMTGVTLFMWMKSGLILL